MHKITTLLITTYLLLLKSDALSLKSDRLPYGVNLKFSIKPSFRENFLSLIKENQRKTLELEPLSLQYTVGEDTENPNTFYIHEQFVGAKGLDAHRDMEHAADWAAFKKQEPFTEGGEPTLEFYYCEYQNEISKDEDIIKVPMDRSCYGVHVELFPKPELREEFLEVIKNNQKGSMETEPLCLQYVFGESTSEDNKFVFHEEYAGKDGGLEGFLEHQKSSHFAAWEEFASKDPFTKPPVVAFFRTIE